MKTTKKETKKAVMTLGCAGALFSALNKEFDHPRETEEKASILLCGGLLQTGHQCGMLWGSTLAAGAEAFRKAKNKDKAIGLAIETSRNLLKSYANRTGTNNCKDVTQCDFSKPLGLVKYLVTGKTITCRRLAASWAPEAMHVAKNELVNRSNGIPKKCKSCASEVAKKMGASDEEVVLVSGFAGGVGLSGNACGALGAAIYMKMLDWFRNHPGKTPSYFKNPEAEKVMHVFNDVTHSKILCSEICEKRFNTLAEHTEFIEKGGCSKLIDSIAST